MGAELLCLQLETKRTTMQASLVNNLTPLGFQWSIGIKRQNLIELDFIVVDLEWNPALAKDVYDSGSTPLHYVASARNISALKLLLRYDTSLAYVPDSNGFFPVHIAANMGYGQVIYELSKHCPDSDEKLDSKGRTFYMLLLSRRTGKLFGIYVVPQNSKGC